MLFDLCLRLVGRDFIYHLHDGRHVAVTAQLEGQATANVGLGFSVADSTQSLMQAFTATKNVSEAMQVNAAAMDLARAKNLDLGTATNQVILAMEGQGRALATYGIQIKDGLSGMAALQAVQGAVNGQAQAYAATLSGQLAVAMDSFNKLIADMGNTQLPLLIQLLTIIVKIIDAVDDWTQKHQKLTEAILVFMGVLGVLLVVLGTIMAAAGAVAIALAGGLSAAFIGTAGAAALAIAAVVALGVAIVSNWKTISEMTEAVWNDQMARFEAIWVGLKVWWMTTWNEVTNWFNGSLKDFNANWNLVWQGMANIVTNVWTVIENTVKSGFDTIITAINAFINALDSIHISIPAITIPGTKIGTPALDLGFNIPDIPMLASGGIVYNPVLAMIGEQGPEAVIPLSQLGSTGYGGIGGGSQQQIVININGGIFPADQSSIKQIGDMLAKQILTQIRVKNYQP